MACCPVFLSTPWGERIEVRAALDTRHRPGSAGPSPSHGLTAAGPSLSRIAGEAKGGSDC